MRWQADPCPRTLAIAPQRASSWHGLCENSAVRRLPLPQEDKPISSGLSETNRAHCKTSDCSGEPDGAILKRWFLPQPAKSQPSGSHPQVPPVAHHPKRKLPKPAIGVTAVLVLAALLAAAWFWPHEARSPDARGSTQAGTEVKQGLAPAPNAPPSEASKLYRVAAEDKVHPAHATATKPSAAEASALASAQLAPFEEVPFLRRGERVIKVYPDGLLVECSDAIGLRKVKFKTLPESIQRQYGYDPRKAAEHEAQQAQAVAAYRTKELRREAEARERQLSDWQSPSDADRGRIAILSQIVSDYYRIHTYLKEDKFVCTDMACDVWDIVKTKGIPAKIQVGSVESDIGSLRAANHAWVLAEASPGKWIALETTAGRLVYPDENPRYYRGWSFDSPKKLKEAFKP